MMIRTSDNTVERLEEALSEIFGKLHSLVGYPDFVVSRNAYKLVESLSANAEMLFATVRRCQRLVQQHKMQDFVYDNWKISSGTSPPALIGQALLEICVELKTLCDSLDQAVVNMATLELNYLLNHKAELLDTLCLCLLLVAFVG